MLYKMTEDRRGLGVASVDETRRRAENVAADHYLHWLAMLGAAAYAWQLHNLFLGVAVLIGLVVVISVTNVLLLSLFQSFAVVRANRWAWVILAYAALAWSGASIGRV